MAIATGIERDSEHPIAEAIRAQALQATREEAEQQGQAVVYLANEDGLVVQFAIADVIRQESYEAVQQLHSLAIPLAMGILAPIGITLAPAVGAALMSASTVIVAINAQLLRRTKLVTEA